MTTKQTPTTALALYSGGLDSTLACRVVAEQGINVVAVKFVTPFFGYDLLLKKDEYIASIKEKFAIDVLLKDVTVPYLQLLKNPAHGFGRYFNPCIDCKIFLLQEAKQMMAETGASFLVTGEVVGQRPMSQRRDTLRVIERDSGCEGILVRPLSAQKLAATQAELDGLIDRRQLLAFSGRNRTPQMKLADKFGITDYPSPAGGCILADPVLSERIQNYYQRNRQIVPADILLLLVGRQLRLPTGGWLVVGRNKLENNKIEELRQPGDWLLQPKDIPGPTAILRDSTNQDELKIAAGVVTRYVKQSALEKGFATIIADCENSIYQIESPALDHSVLKPWLRT